MAVGERDDPCAQPSTSPVGHLSQTTETMVSVVEAMADLATPFAVRLMATCRIADALLDTPMRVEDLAELRGMHEPTLRAVVHHLVALGLLDRDVDGKLRLTDTGAVLHPAAPGGLGRRFDLTSALGRADLAFVALHDSLHTGAVAFDTYFGSDYWSVLRRDPELVDSFQQSMAQHDELVAAAVLASCRPAPGSTVVDVGGGAGGILARLLEANAEVHGLLVDLPESAEHALRTAVQNGLGDRLHIAPSDIRSMLPAGHDTYLVSMVLHDWPDDAAQQILRACRRAAPMGADLVVIEFDPEAMSPSTASAIDLHLMVCAGAKQRDIAEHGELFASTGWNSWSVAERVDGVVAFRAQ